MTRLESISMKGLAGAGAVAWRMLHGGAALKERRMEKSSCTTDRLIRRSQQRAPSVMTGQRWAVRGRPFRVVTPARPFSEMQMHRLAGVGGMRSWTIASYDIKSGISSLTRRAWQIMTAARNVGQAQGHARHSRAIDPKSTCSQTRLHAS